MVYRPGIKFFKWGFWIRIYQFGVYFAKYDEQLILYSERHGYYKNRTFYFLGLKVKFL